jgi:hypothetical protein
MNSARQGGVPTALVFETSEPQGNDDRAPGWLKSVVADCVDHRKPMVIRTGTSCRARRCAHGITGGDSSRRCS